MPYYTNLAYHQGKAKSGGCPELTGIDRLRARGRPRIFFLGRADSIIGALSENFFLARAMSVMFDLRGLRQPIRRGSGQKVPQKVFAAFARTRIDEICKCHPHSCEVGDRRHQLSHAQPRRNAIGGDDKM